MFIANLFFDKVYMQPRLHKFLSTHYVAVEKTIHVYLLLHDIFNESCNLFK